METRCRRIRLKPGSVERVREWAQTLRSRTYEVIETLSDEGVSIESAFLEQTSEGDFLIYYMRAVSLDEASRVSGASTHDIDAYHREVLSEIAEPGENLELLIDFQGPEPSASAGRPNKS